jgi:hypothetical protein
VLKVHNTGELVRARDVRLLSVPVTNWKWPEEGVRIERAYPSVIYVPGSPPSVSFPPGWWASFNHCVYDGVACGLP